MRINNWSVVKSPIGVSLLHMPKNEPASRAEVCVDIVGGVLSISVHIDGFDPPYSTMEIPIESINAIQPPHSKPAKRTKKGKKK